MRELIDDPQMPSIWELIDNTSMVFINTHHALHGVRPVSPAVLELAGIHMRKLKPLQPKLKLFLDAADNGVVYINFGMDIRTSSLPPSKLRSIRAALISFKFKSVWRWETGTFPNPDANIYADEWLPQKEILCKDFVCCCSIVSIDSFSSPFL